MAKTPAPLPTPKHPLPEGTELVTIALPPSVWPEFERGVERIFPGIEFYRLPPEAENEGETCFGIRAAVPF